MPSFIVRKMLPVVGRTGTIAANILRRMPGITNVEVDSLTETDNKATVSYDGAPDNDLDNQLATAGLMRE